MMEYTSKHIKTIDELIDHIRQNVGMYAGETDSPLHLFEECFTNSLDESIDGHANIVAININQKENVYEIIDNGRGIPLDNDVPVSISTKFSGSKFKNSKSVYKICCLKGDTKLLSLDGKNYTIGEMAKNPSEEYWGLSSTTDGKFKATKLLYPQITGYTKKMIKVYLDNGNIEECTPDHLWLMRNGNYKKAEDLKSEDSLMPCYYKEKNGYYVIRPNYTYDYERNIKLEGRSYVYLHRIVYESIFGEIPKFYCVHHKDMDRKNNIPHNFKLLHHKYEHLKEHAKINFENGIFYSRSLLRYNKSEKGRKKSRENAYKYAIPALNKYTETEKHKEDKRKLMSDYNKKVDQKYLQKCKILKHCKNLLDKNIEINDENWKIDKKLRTPNFKRALDYFENVENLILESKKYNHKIIKTEIINYDEEIPVYDICSPEYSNFVLESGTIVHNSGKHGVGLVVVNALSDWYKIEVYRDNKHAIFLFENGKLKSKTIDNYKDKVPFSTKVSFKPNKEFFNEEKIPIEKIKNRLLTASVELENCTFVLNNDDKREVIKLNKYDYFNNNCVSNGDKELTELIEINTKDKYEKFDILFCYSKDGPLSPKFVSSLNVLPVEDGGTHITVFTNILKEFLTTKAKKLGFKFQSTDCVSRLRCYLSLYIEQPEFGAQSKDKLTNRIPYFEKLSKKLRSGLEIYFSKKDDLLNEILQSLHDYRKNIESKKFRSTNSKVKRGSTKFTKLKDCSSNKGELFIAEGDSASGNLTKARNPEIHAVLPLKGKIPSIENKGVLENLEVKELIKSIGTGIEPDFDITKLKYDKIICATDADPDGSHIFCLMAMIFLKYMPELIRQNKFYLARTPLRAINEKNIFIPLWSDEDYNKAIEDKRKVTRFKGLGELNSWQLKISVLDNKTRRLISVSYPENKDFLFSLFKNPEERRKLLVNDEIKILEDV